MSAPQALILILSLLIGLPSLAFVLYRRLSKLPLDWRDIGLIVGLGVGLAALLVGLWPIWQQPNLIIERVDEVVPPSGIFLTNLECARILDELVNPVAPHYDFQVRNAGKGHARNVSFVVEVPRQTTAVAVLAVLDPDLQCASSARWRVSPTSQARLPSSLIVEIDSLASGERIVLAVGVSPLAPGDHAIALTVNGRKKEVKAQVVERQSSKPFQLSKPASMPSVLILCYLRGLDIIENPAYERLRGDIQAAGVDVSFRDYDQDEDVIFRVREGRCHLFLLPYSEPLKQARTRDTALVLYRVAYVFPYLQKSLHDVGYDLTDGKSLKLGLLKQTLSRRHAEALGTALYGANPCTAPPSWDCAEKPVDELQAQWDKRQLELAVVSDIRNGERVRAFTRQGVLVSLEAATVESMNRAGRNIYFFASMPGGCLLGHSSKDPVGLAAVPILLGAPSWLGNVAHAVAERAQWDDYCDGDVRKNILFVIAPRPRQ